MDIVKIAIGMEGGKGGYSSIYNEFENYECRVKGKGLVTLFGHLFMY